MKTKLFLGLAAVALATVSCTNEEVIDSAVSKKDNAISFSTYAQGTRAAGDNNEIDNSKLNANGSSFGVVGYLESDVTYNGVDHTAGERCMYDNTKITFSGKTENATGSWGYADATKMAFWPGVKVDFYAYYPYAESGVTFANPLTDGTALTIPVDGSKDFLYAHVEHEKTAEAGATVTIPFHHVYAKIKEINLKTTLALNVDVTSVEVCNVKHTGSVTVAKGGTLAYPASPTGNRKKTFTEGTTVATTSAEKKLVDIDDNWYIFPVGNSAFWTTASTGDDITSDKVCIKLHAKITAGEKTVHNADIFIPMCSTKTTSGADFSIVAGKRYTFNINLKDGIGYDKDGKELLTPIMFNATVDSWTDANGKDVTVDITL